MIPENLPTFYFEYNTLLHQIMALNAVYLGASITIILAIGGGFYVLNVKPFLEKLAKTEERVAEQNTQITELIDEGEKFRLQSENALSETKEQALKEKEANVIKITGLEKRLLESISESEKKLKDLTESTKRNVDVATKKLQEQIDRAEFINEWREHWTWVGQDIPVNILSTLTSSLEKTEAKPRLFTMQELPLNRLIDLLQTEKQRLSADPDIDEYFQALKEILDKIETSNNHEKIEKIRKIMKEY